MATNFTSNNDFVYTYFIDTYLDGVFFSRSEPFYDEEECVNFVQKMKYDGTLGASGTQYTYKIQVSMDLDILKKLELKANRVRIKYLEKDTNSDEMDVSDTVRSDTVRNNTVRNDTVRNNDNSQPIKCYRYNGGYLFFKNKNSLTYIRNSGIMDYMTPINNIGKKGSLYLADTLISLHEIVLPDNLIIKTLPDKYLV